MWTSRLFKHPLRDQKYVEALQHKFVMRAVRQFNIKTQLTAGRLNIAFECGKFQIATGFLHYRHSRLL